MLHPSATTYELLHGRSPWDDEHKPFEGVLTLVRALVGWPKVRIVLTTTLPWSRGLPKVLHLMGPLAANPGYPTIAAQPALELLGLVIGVVRKTRAVGAPPIPHVSTLLGGAGKAA